MATSGDLIRVEHVIKEFNHGAVKALNDCSLTIADVRLPDADIWYGWNRWIWYPQ